MCWIPTDLIVDQQLHWRHRCLWESLLLVTAEVLKRDVGLQQRVFDEDWQRSQDEGGKQIHVDVVPHAVQLPDEWEAVIVSKIIIHGSDKLQHSSLFQVIVWDVGLYGYLLSNPVLDEKMLSRLKYESPVGSFY